MKIGVVMDPIEKVVIAEDTSFAILLHAQTRGWECFYIEPHKIWLQDGITWAEMYPITVADDPKHWYDLGKPVVQPLVDLDACFLRKDPPFDMNYIYLTYLLEQAQAQGLKIINDPTSVRSANEKFFTVWFPQCCPKTLITSQPSQLREFLAQQEHIVIKPLHGKGGESVFQVRVGDPNVEVILETMTQNNTRMVMAQCFIPDIVNGDKRILLINGEPIPYALARIPKAGDFRGNMCAGASIEGRELTERDRWICEQVGPMLREKGLLLVGLDVIGDYLTEINVTSPTCARELEAMFEVPIISPLLDLIAEPTVCS